MSQQHSDPGNGTRVQRLSRRKLLLDAGTAGVGMAGLAAVGCGGGSTSSTNTPAPAGSQGAGSTAAASPSAVRFTDTGTLTIPVSGNVINLDPHANVTSTGLAMAYLRHICSNGLLYQDYDLKWKPDLAESVTVSDDGLVYSVRLKSGIKLSNGKPLTSKVVISNFERAAVTQGSKQVFSLVKGYDAISDTDFKINLTQASGPFLAILNTRVFLADMDGLDINHPIGAGPWVLDDWAVNQQLTFHKNPDFYDAKRIHFDKLVVKLNVDQQAQYNGLQSGQYDITGIPPEQVADAKGNKNVQYIQIAGLACDDHIYLKTSEPPFNDPRLRQAVDLAIDRNEIRDVVYSGLHRPGASWLPPSDPFYVQEVDAWNVDLNQAKTLVQQVGANGMEIEYQYRVDGVVPAFATLIQGQLAKIGLKIKLTPVELAKYTSDVIFAKKFKMASYASSWRPDPDGMFYIYYYSTGSANFNEIKDPEIDRLLDLARTQTTFADRQKTYAEFQKRARELRAFITTGQGALYNVAKSDIVGYRIHPDSTVVFYQDVGRKA